jgi:hypothetical protein
MASGEACPRLDPILWLANQANISMDLPQLIQQETQARQLHGKHGLPPTIGCEIEVKWSSLFPDLAREYFGEADELGRFKQRYTDLSTERQKELDEICRQQDAELKPRYEATTTAGIPIGKDAYWEFANSPSYAWQTLAKETSLLMTNGYVPGEADHSLHVTLGSLAADGGGPALLLSGLELAYGSANRLRLATEPTPAGFTSAWARRGTDGIRARSAVVLELGHTRATEFRTLGVDNPESLSQTLRAAQMLGTVLLAYRQRQKSVEPVVQELAQLWPEFRKDIKDLWDARDLPAASWGAPHRNPKPWLQWAECLERRQHSNTPEYEMMTKIQSLVINAEVLLAELTV